MNNLTKRDAVKRIVLNGLMVEVAVLLMVSGLVGIWHPAAAKAGLLGALAFFIPNTYFVVNAFRFVQAPLTTWIVHSFYRGHTGKLVLSALAFALVFHFHRDLHHGAMFLGFICMILVNIWMTKRAATQLTRVLSHSGDEQSYRAHPNDGR